MTSKRIERRTALTTIAAAAATPAFTQQTGAQPDKPHEHPTVVIEKPLADWKPKFFTPAELETVAVLADFIIPRTDTPGARDANAHRIIDRSVRQADRKVWKDGLAWLHKMRFTTKPQSEQIAVLESAAKESGTLPARFFRVLKDATIDAYYSTREGLVTELGWNANTYLPEFKGCTHPEHQS